MPVYLCVPGSNSPEPWRHGMPVYELPFPFDSSFGKSSNANSNNHEYNNDDDNNETFHDATLNSLHDNDSNSNNNNNEDQFQMHQYEDDDNRYTTHILAGSRRNSNTNNNQHNNSNNNNNNNSNAPTNSSAWDINAVLAAGRKEPIRRVKHAEIVLVDEVNVYYGNYWLRLRWPGKRGGVAGYIPLGGVDVIPIEEAERVKEGLMNSTGDNFMQLTGATSANSGGGGHGETDAVDGGDGIRDERRGGDVARDANLNSSFGQDRNVCTVIKSQSYNSDQEPSIPEEEGDELGLSDPPTELPHESNSRLIKCESTGYYFPSTEAMKLLAQYDDGLSSSGVMEDGQDAMDDMDNNGNRGEPVFCRICRDGLHDIDYDFGMEGDKKEKKEKKDSTPNETNDAIGAAAGAAAGDADATDNLNRVPTRSFKRHSVVENTGDAPSENDTSEMPYMMQNHLLNNSRQYRDQTNQEQFQLELQQENDQPSSEEEIKQPIKAEQTNHPYAENPLLSPCECAGSMAFVHYLCIEQWRCRSNHPAAKNGLNCETCKVAYTLPPPPSRPESAEEDEWLQAMPPHVLGALRNPHICWQIGAAIVRRRWLRPIAPIITSPIVALYCRARRSLKKRGVSRRRWACSLCGRRARWKCVRCLRSYYCSRQCQNVSWHIVHKHVCYKPARFWWSVVVYGLASVYFIPGNLSYPLIYDLGIGMLWLSFIVMGVIAGGIATILKREMATDIRGRTLELSVVLMTVWLAWVGWGLIWSFFGVRGDDQCVGVMDKMGRLQSFIGIPTLSFFQSDSNVIHPSRVQLLVQNGLLKPIKAIIGNVDKGLLKTPQFVTNWICSPDENEDVSMQTCLEIARKTNPEFMLQENGGEQCSSDFNVMMFFFYSAMFIHGLGTVWKHRRDNRGGRRQRHHPRPHQD